MDEQQLRAELRKREIDIKKHRWERLIEEGCVGRAVSSDTPVGTLMLDYLKMLAWDDHQHPGRPKSTKSTKQEPVSFEESDRRLAEVQSDYFAKEAGESDWLELFRQLHFGGGVLNQEQALAFVGSAAVQHMSPDQFREWGIPVLGSSSLKQIDWGGRPFHTVLLDTLFGVIPATGKGKNKGHCSTREVGLTFVEPKECAVILRACTRFTIDGYVCSSGKAAPEFPIRNEGCTIGVAYLLAMLQSGHLKPGARPADVDGKSWLEACRLWKKRRDMWPTSGEHDVELEAELHYLNGNGGDATVSVWRGSVLDQVRGGAEWLADYYHWRRADATWFILTGKPPSSNPLWAETTSVAGHGYIDALVKLEVRPWVSPKTLKQLYVGIQRRYVGSCLKPEARTLEVFRFVTDECGTKVGKDTPWKSLLEAWLSKHPEEKVIMNPSRLRLYYSRGRKTVLEAGLHQDAQKSP